MRKIKFRSWNGDMMSKPFYPTELSCDEQGSWVDADGVSVSWDAEGYRHCENWMQFTGLLDRNGKEIYEGDILRENSTNYTTYTGPVVFLAGCFRFNYRPGNYSTIAVNGQKQLNRIEVIGNICDNPDLLK